jgi:hypothetical protein
MKSGLGSLLIVVFVLIGEVRCIYKAVTCNWEPIGKAEIVYTVSAITGLGCIVGYIDIQDK